MAAFRAEGRKLVPHWLLDSANGGGVTNPRHSITFKKFNIKIKLSLRQGKHRYQKILIIISMIYTPESNLYQMKNIDNTTT